MMKYSLKSSTSTSIQGMVTEAVVTKELETVWKSRWLVAELRS
jgi:hypothetical protein